MACGPGEVADKSPRRVRHPPAGAGWSRRRTCAPESYLWAPAGVPSSPCSNTAPSQPPALAARLRYPPRRLLPAALPVRATEVRPAGCAQSGAGLHAGPPGRRLPVSHAPLRPRAAGITASGQTLLINRRTRRLRRPRRQPAFISARRGGPAPAPCPRGRPPRGPLLSRGAGLRARERPPGGAVRARAVSGSLLRAQGANQGWGGHPPDFWAARAGKKGALLRAVRGRRLPPASSKQSPRGSLGVGVSHFASSPESCNLQ